MTSDSLVIRGAREHNLKNVEPRASARPADRFHRSFRVGKVLLGLRHHLCRGPAALCGIPFCVCPPVPRADGQTRRRLHRGALAGDLDRPENRLPQPPLDGGDGYRDPRLSAAALGPDRDSPLSDPWAAGQTPDTPADRRPGPATSARGPGSRCWRRWFAAARASTRRC